MNTFLNSYHPKDEHVTSFKEIDIIRRELNLDNVDLFETRNKVVEFYHDKMVFEREHGIDEWPTMIAMQSVTAAIDFYKSKKGLPV